jgi:rhodanese-related sulfurtransferase
VFGRPPIPVVRARDVSADAYLIDVREDDEWLAGHAPGAVHLPMIELPDRLDEVPRDRDVVIVCRSGHRSAEVVSYLIGRGIGNVRNLADGMLGWAATGRPLVSGRSSRPGAEPGDGASTEDGDVATVL